MIFTYFISCLISSLHASDSFRSIDAYLTAQAKEKAPGLSIEIDLYNEADKNLRLVEVEEVQWGSLEKVSYRFRAEGQTESIAGAATLKYSKRTLVPRDRIAPFQNGRSEQFELREVRVTNEDLISKDYENWITSEPKLSQLRTIHTLLPGQPIKLSQFQRLPDIQKGSVIFVQVQSNGLAIQTEAITQEEGFVGESLRVISKKTGKLLQGKLIQEKLVEIKL